MKKRLTFWWITCGFMAGMPLAGNTAINNSVGNDAIRIDKPGAKDGHYGAAVSVAAAGDFILMGTPEKGQWWHDPGAAYLFENGNSTPSVNYSLSGSFFYDYQNFSVTAQGEITPTTQTRCSFQYRHTDGARFGTEVALSERWVAMVGPNLGEGNEQIAPATCAGISGRVPTVLLSETPSHASSGPYFGRQALNSPLRHDIRDIAITDNDLVIVAGKGAHVYLFNEAINRWEYNTTLLPNITLGDEFYEGLAIKGNRIVLGSPNESKVYVFKKVNGNWLEEAAGSMGSYNSEWGKALDFDGDFIAASGNDYLQIMKINSFGGLYYVDSKSHPSGFDPAAHVAMTEGHIITYSLPEQGPFYHGTEPARTAHPLYQDHYGNLKFRDSTHNFGLDEVNTTVKGTSLAVSGNSVIIGAPDCEEQQQFTFKTGCILFDKFTNPFSQSVILDNAEGHRLWVNEGSLDWLRGRDGVQNYYYVDPVTPADNTDYAILRTQRLQFNNYSELKFNLFMNGDSEATLSIEVARVTTPDIVNIHESLRANNLDDLSECEAIDGGWYTCTFSLLSSHADPFGGEPPHIQFRYIPNYGGGDVRLDDITIQ